jgi:hypothetical protein
MNHNKTKQNNELESLLAPEDNDVCSQASTIVMETDEDVKPETQYTDRFDIRTFPCKQIRIPNLTLLLEHMRDTNQSFRVGSYIVHQLNDVTDAFAYIVGGVIRDITIGHADAINDVDLVVYGITTPHLRDWLFSNGYGFTEVHGNFTLTEYKVDISVGKKIMFNRRCQNCEGQTIYDDVQSRDAYLNCGLIDLRGGPKVYDLGNGQLMKDLETGIITTPLTNLRTVFRFRPTFLFRLIKLSIRLSIMCNKSYVLDPIILNKTAAITTENPVTLSKTWSSKFIKSLSNEEFVQFMKVIQDRPFLLKFIRGGLAGNGIWKTWVNKIRSLDKSFKIPIYSRSSIKEAFVFSADNFPPLGT